MLLLALSMVETAEEAAKLTRLYELYSTEMYHAAKNILRNHHDASRAGPPIYTATNSGAALCLWTSWRRCPFRRPRPMCPA